MLVNPRRRTATVAVLGMSALAVTSIVLTASPATAAPSPKASSNALAAQSAASLVAARPASIHASKDDAHLAHSAISTREGLSTATVTVNNPGSQSGYVGVNDALPMNASGGTGPYTWSATGLPPGKTINTNTGRITGAPTTAGTYQTTVTATDSTNTTASTTFTWTITTGPLTVTNPGNQSGYVGVNDALPMNASGGTGPYTWSATGLPPGKTINTNTGRITGAPTTAGTYQTTVTTTDSTNTTASTTFTWTITTGPLTVTNPGSQSGYVGVNDALPMNASGGTGPYTWSATGLPPGKTINTNTGRITGAPTTAGTYQTTVTTTDSTNTTASTTFTWTITTGPLTVTNPGSQSGYVGVNDALPMNASGGTGPYTWSATGLPPGKTINTNTGRITGAPTTAGTYQTTVTTTDSTNTTASTTFTWTITQR